MTRKTKKETFFIALHEKEGEATGHSVFLNPDKELSEKPAEPKVSDMRVEAKSPTDFGTVLQNFVTSVESFRKFIPLTIEMAPIVLEAVVGRRIIRFATTKGTLRADLSKPNARVFELDASCFREFGIITDELDASIQGTKIFPELGIVGLVSAYDAFLSTLLKTVLAKHEEIFLLRKNNYYFLSC